MALYNTEYQRENIVIKKIKFNRKKEDDMALLDWINLQDNYSRYIKDLIRADMKEPHEDYQII